MKPRLPADVLKVACNKMRTELENQGAIWLALKEMLGSGETDCDTVFSEYGRHGLKQLLQMMSDRAHNATHVDAFTEQLLQ